MFTGDHSGRSRWQRNCSESRCCEQSTNEEEMKFEQWKRKNLYNVSWLLHTNDMAPLLPCTVCGKECKSVLEVFDSQYSCTFEYFGCGEIDHFEMIHKENLCYQCYAKRDHTAISRFESGAYWRSLRSMRNKKMFRMQMLREIYQRGVASRKQYHPKSKPSK